jgi:radical SAM protein with 4Fe4S-binding SPASM domain
VDGITREVYQQYRKQGNLDLVLINIRRLVKRKKALASTTPVIEWQMLEFPWNRHQIDDAYQMAMALGVDKFRCIPGDIHDSSVPSLEPRTDKGPEQMGTDRLQEMKILLHEKQTNFEYFGCDHLYRHLCIYSDGSTHPCYNVVAPSHAIGNIFKDGAESIVNGRYQMANRKLFKKNIPEKITGYDPCLNCELIVGNSQHRGHAFSALDFSVAFKAITGGGIHDFLESRQPYHKKISRK